MFYSFLLNVNRKSQKQKIYRLEWLPVAIIGMCEVGHYITLNLYLENLEKLWQILNSVFYRWKGMQS